MADDGKLQFFYHDHRELDARLRSVHAAKNGLEARLLLLGAMAAAREHFQREELEVFPLLDARFQEQHLRELGQAWQDRCAASTPAPSPLIPIPPAAPCLVAQGG